MIQVTGFLTSKENGRYYKDPLIKLVPHMGAVGIMTVDAQLFNEENQVGGIGFENVPIDLFTASEGNAYSFIIDKIEEYVIASLQEINPDCTFTKV